MLRPSDILFGINTHYLHIILRYYHKIPEELPELELKATFGLAAPIPFEMPAVHSIFTEEAYKDFTVNETAPPKIVSTAPCKVGPFVWCIFCDLTDWHTYRRRHGLTVYLTQHRKRTSLEWCQPKRLILNAKLPEMQKEAASHHPALWSFRIVWHFYNWLIWLLATRISRKNGNFSAKLFCTRTTFDILLFKVSLFSRARTFMFVKLWIEL